MNNRFHQFLQAENISQSQFAESINVARASISHILAGRNKPGFDFLESMARAYPSLSLDWLITGKGRMYKNQETPASLFPEIEEIEENHPNVKENMDSLDILEAPQSEDSPQIHENRQVHESSEIIKDKIQEISTHTIVRQRNIVKIIALYDDGSFQELKDSLG